MDPTLKINERVDVVTVFRSDGLHATKAVPHKMRWRTKDVTFERLGLRHDTAKGKRMIHVFDMHDGSNDYRLEFDAEALTWTLVAVIEGGVVA